jgi:hypothetical protein
MNIDWTALGTLIMIIAFWGYGGKIIGSIINIFKK